MNSRTWPKRRVSQPVSGSEIALATPKEVMTQVPWSGETPRSPAIAGIETLAIEVSSTFMKVASDSAIVPIASCAPVSGGRAGRRPAWSTAGRRPVSILTSHGFALCCLCARSAQVVRAAGHAGRAGQQLLAAGPGAPRAGQ